jgi:hypothetical protein
MIELHDRSAPDAEDFFACLLAPVIRAAVEHTTSDGWPFALITRVAGADDPDAETDDPVVQVDILGEGVLAASDAANTVHRRILWAARACADVTMLDGTVVNPDFITVMMKPVRMSYPDERIVRYVARYAPGLSYVTVT